MMLLIPILILVTSILFISGVLSLDVTKKFLLHVKKPFLSSPTSSPPYEPISSPKDKPITTTTTNMVTKDGGGDEDDLKRVFDTFDKNGDGFITKEELKESLSNMGIMVLGKDIEEMVENLDFNKDGFVDIGEFRELYEMVKEKKNDDEGNKVSEDDEDLKEAFNVFDDNKDGLITVEELGLVLSSLGLKQGNRKEECMEMINKVDVDGDGMVNFEEFKMMMRARCSTSTSSKLLHAF